MLTAALGAMNVAAQSETDNNNKLHSPDGLFNHLSIGVSTGLSGSGIDVTMPVHRLVTVRAGYSGLHLGDIKFKAINTAEELAGYALVEDDAVRRAQMSDKIELAAKPNFWNMFLLAEIHPFNNDSFHFTAGLYVGSKNFVHFRNTNEGALGFLYDANNKVDDYNRLSFALDFGLIFWGSPKFLLNNGKEIKSSGKEAGITQVLSWLKAWPSLQVKVAYKIF